MRRLRLKIGHDDEVGKKAAYAKADIKADASKAKADVENKLAHEKADAEKTKANLGKKMDDALR